MSQIGYAFHPLYYIRNGANVGQCTNGHNATIKRASFSASPLSTITFLFRVGFDIYLPLTQFRTEVIPARQTGKRGAPGRFNPEVNLIEEPLNQKWKRIPTLQRTHFDDEDRKLNRPPCIVCPIFYGPNLALFGGTHSSRWNWEPGGSRPCGSKSVPCWALEPSRCRMYAGLLRGLKRPGKKKRELEPASRNVTPDKHETLMPANF